MTDRTIKTLGEAIRQFIEREGLLSRRPGDALSTAWKEVAGEGISSHTRVCALKSGILQVEVDSAPLLHELDSFRKNELLEALKRACPRSDLRGLRFTVQSR